MEMGGGEDPFGSLIKLCQPTSSQELKLHTCPFARESETFPDAFDSLGSSFSPAWTQSPPQGIIMVSVSDSEDENAPLENEEFQTPPEEHLVSSSSSQEDPHRNLKPISAVDEKVEMQRETIVDRNGDTESGVENIGFSETEERRGGGDTEPGLENIGFSETEGDTEPGVEKRGFSETEEIRGCGDTEPGLEKLGFWKTEETRGGEDTEPGVENIGFTETGETRGGENGVMGVNCLERDGVAGELKEFGISEGESEEPALKKIRVSKEVPDSVMHTMQVEGAQIIEKVDNDDNELINLAIVESDEDKILIDLESEEEFEDIDDDDEVSNNGGKGTPDCKINRQVEVENSTTGGPHFDCNNPREEKEGTYLDNGDMSVLRNGDLAMEEPDEGLRNNRDGKSGKYGKEVLGCMNVEDIDAFKYNGGGGGGGDNGDHHWKEVGRRKRELPLSLREKGQDMGRKGNNRNLDAKNLSWNELLDAVAVLLKKVDRGSEDVDFLEMAKRRGMNFPQPRWI